MADTVTFQTTTLATPAGGTVVATDDAGASGQVQIVKLALSADGSATAITADTNGLEVQGAGTAGTAAGGVVTVQGVASMTPIQVGDNSSTLSVDDGGGNLSIDDGGNSITVDVGTALPAGTNNIGDVDVLSVVPGTSATSLGKAEDAAHGSGDTGVMALAVRRDAAAASSGTDGDYEPLSTDNAGQLRVNVGNTVTVGSHAVTNAGTFAVQVDGNALTALQLIDDPVFADDAAFTIGTSKVKVVGGVVDDASTDSADEGDAAAIRVTASRQVVVNPQPHTVGGLTIFRSLDLDETEEEVKASAGQVYGMWVTNLATSTRFLKFYNATAANVSVGTTTPVITFAIPGNASDDISAVFGNAMGIAFDTAITVAATTGIADADTGAPGANEVLVNIFYK